jgi:hypothetical protein
MKITEIDYTTNPETVIERDATPDELAQWQKDQESELARQAELVNKEALKVSALAKLAALGLTEDEARAILGQ